MDTGQQIAIQDRANILKGDEDGIVFFRLTGQRCLNTFGTNIPASTIHQYVDPIKFVVDLRQDIQDRAFSSQITINRQAGYPVLLFNAFSDRLQRFALIEDPRGIRTGAVYNHVCARSRQASQYGTTDAPRGAGHPGCFAGKILFFVSHLNSSL